MLSQFKKIIRSIYSSPPLQGGRLIALILSSIGAEGRMEARTEHDENAYDTNAKGAHDAIKF